MRWMAVLCVAVMVTLVSGQVDGGSLRALAGIRFSPERLDDEQTPIFYFPSTGALEVLAPASTNLTSINIDSAALGFIVDNVDTSVFDGSFDNTSADNLFKATFGGSFGSIALGVGVMEPNLSPIDLIEDLTVVGSLEGGGDLGAVDLIYWVPEPSSLLLALLGVAGLLHWRRWRE